MRKNFLTTLQWNLLNVAQGTYNAEMKSSFSVCRCRRRTLPSGTLLVEHSYVRSTTGVNNVLSVYTYRISQATSYNEITYQKTLLRNYHFANCAFHEQAVGKCQFVVSNVEWLELKLVKCTFSFRFNKLCLYINSDTKQSGTYVEHSYAVERTRVIWLEKRTAIINVL